MDDARPKALFLEINSSHSHSMLSYCLIRALVEKQNPNWQWHAFEATLKTPIQEVIAAVELNAPEVILATAYIFNVDRVCEIVALLKKSLPKLQVYLGGPCFLGDNEVFLREHKYIDGVIRGDESSITKLLATESQKAFEKVAGLCYLNDSSYCDNGWANFTQELDKLPSPYGEEYIHQNKPFYQIEGSRGCLGQCSFCCSAIDSGVKKYSIERIKSDLEKLFAKGFREIRLIDRTFNADAERAVALLKLFRNSFPTMKFHLELHPGLLNEQLLNELGNAPQEQLHIEAGVQSFDPQVLKNIRRASPPGKVEDGLRALVALENFEVHADLIAGLPGQTLESLENDLSEMFQIAPQEIQLELLKILPGTPLSNTVAKWGITYQTTPPWQVLASSDMSQPDLQKVMLYSHVVDSYYNTKALHNSFLFCVKYYSSFFFEFCEFFDKHRSNNGKLALDKRFFLLLEFLQGKGFSEAVELVRFAIIAAGFKLPGLKLLKSEPPNGKLIWQRDNAKTAIARCVKLRTSFDVAEFWLKGVKSSPNESYHNYAFLMHYGRNVHKIVEFEGEE